MEAIPGIAWLRSPCDEAVSVDPSDTVVVEVFVRAAVAEDPPAVVYSLSVAPEGYGGGPSARSGADSEVLDSVLGVRGLAALPDVSVEVELTPELTPPFEWLPLGLPAGSVGEVCFFTSLLS
jgi:hypothetical protein